MRTLCETLRYLKAPVYIGWGTWIRTREMPDSESGALPLGYTPMRLDIILFFFIIYNRKL